MPFSHSHNTTHTTHATQPTRAHKPSLLSRLTHRTPHAHAKTTTRAPRRSGRRTHHAKPVIPATGPATTTTAATATAAPLHHRRRRPSLGDKVSGAILKLKGTITSRPGQKAAGTRRMHGTDGRASKRVY